ncbi:TonB-dependent receptor domain-containing protein [Kinneretia aquatilis]|jgi:outer membrane receptor protein involved in Fe transport|uniref:TonB-dependent receptor domain-containing protein n=1 Tax=Kinneretia aquatilis TaxID=2070761 RepID=UPI001FB033DD|nr:TonB-dependent receptor [Paucibacter aquatile]
MLKQQPKFSAISAAVLLAVAASAQAQSQTPTQIERVEVTGSRILSAGALAPAPVQVMTAADIASSGAANLQELLLKSPVFGGGAGSNSLGRNNSNFLTSSSGVSTLDLRNLGVDRTLVLVNGRRYVSGIPGSSAVDLNTIPTDFIERVEMLTGGASSTYGSDAVAGVVNIILKRNINGLKLDMQLGRSEKGDDDKKKFSASFGTSGADGRANLMAHFAFTRQGQTMARDHGVPYDQTSLAVLNPKTTNPADIFNVRQPTFSAFAPAGHFYFTDADKKDVDFTYDAAGKQIPWSQNGPAGDGVGATGFNRQAYRAISVPTDRMLLAAKGDYALNDKHQIFFEGTYAATKTKSEIEPFALASSDVYPNTEVVPTEFLINGTMVRNPLVPANVVGDYFFQRRMTDLGSRIQQADRDTFRFVLGMKGEVNPTWSYETYLGYGATKEGQRGNGQVNVLNMRNALEAIPDGKGGVMCRDELARAQGCVPINIFGAGTISPAGVKYIAAPQSLNTKVTQKMAGFTVSGEPFEMPAGPVGIAVGGEWRAEFSEDVHDALTATGLNGGNALPDTKGSFNVKELFVETRLPLLKGLPLIKTLDGIAAVRASDYSTAGKTNSWNTGLDWAANSTVRVRVTKAVSTRAPNVGNLFSAPSQTFPPGLKDPCNGVKSSDTSVLATNCKAAPGVAANMAANGGVFTLTQPDRDGISGFDSGNPDLKPEKGNSTTFGLVITPKGIPVLDKFAFTADYFDISIDKAINTPGRQYALDQCYSGNDTSFCKFITRRPTGTPGNSAGSIDLINEVPVNSGGQVAKGLDFTASYSDKLGTGRVNGRLSYTHLLKAEYKATDTATPDPTAGELGSPRNRWSLSLGYENGPWALSTTTTFIGQSYLNDSFRKGYPQFTKADFKVASKTYLDMQGTYALGKAQFYLGIDNVLNTKPAPIVSGLPGNTTGTATDAGTYDAIGRRYYFGVRYSM